MIWNKSNIKPPHGKPIMILHNIYKENNTVINITTGFLKEVAGDSVWYILPVGIGDRSSNIVPIAVANIHGWCFISHISNRLFNDIYTEPVKITCPHCKETTTVTAYAKHTHYVRVPVCEQSLHKCIALDYDSMYGEFDFDYTCDSCERIISDTFEGVEKLYKKDKAKSFSDDPDKLLDLLLLNKEEFLKSYSYITEEDYNATVEDIKNNFGKKGN